MEYSAVTGFIFCWGSFTSLHYLIYCRNGFRSAYWLPDPMGTRIHFFPTIQSCELRRPVCPYNNITNPESERSTSFFFFFFLLSAYCQYVRILYWQCNNRIWIFMTLPIIWNIALYSGGCVRICLPEEFWSIFCFQICVHKENWSLISYLQKYSLLCMLLLLFKCAKYCT